MGGYSVIKFNEYIIPTIKPEDIIVKRGHDTLRYLNSPNAFDIETSSFKDADGNKRATMYIWMMGINDQIVYGRTWGEFQWFLNYIKTGYDLGPHRRMIIYVHNLGYEFEFLINRVSIAQTFARKKRHPIKTLIEDGFELRCSMFLSGLSLEKTAEELNVKKQIGLLDYSKLRHSSTVLTDDELKYCEYDIKVILEFIGKEIQKCGDITKIPLTKTGYVREYCRKYIEEHYNYKTYREQILKEFPDENLFILLNKAFAGGYTHANVLHLFDILDDVYSIDFTSSYPAQMIMHKYPRGKFATLQSIPNERFRYMVHRYACVFEIKMYKVEALSTHHIWSSSKCDYGTSPEYNAVIDNGRLVKSDCIFTRMTDVDFNTFCKFYKFKENFEITNFHYTSYGYLPKGIIECILKFYEDKTKLKGQAGQEDFYLVAKGMLNAIYGMMVTNPVNDDIIFDLFAEDPKKIWDKKRPSMSEALEKVKNSPKTFLCYQWGVWVTAWARYELLSAVHEIGEDVIYCDTDSIKFLNFESYKKVIADQNIRIENALLQTVKYFNLNPESLSPKDINNEHHQLGIWDFEGKYEKFKTIGAKRYCYVKKGRLSITASGLNPKYVYREDVEHLDLSKLPKDFRKEFADIPKEKWLDHWEKNYKYSPVNYILTIGSEKHINDKDIYGNLLYNTREEAAMRFFDDNMHIPAEYSKRLCHTYIESYYRMVIRDYCNVARMVEEYAYVHLEKQEYRMSISEEFVEFLEDADRDIYMMGRTVRDELAINIFQREISVRDFINKKRRKENG